MGYLSRLARAILAPMTVTGVLTDAFGRITESVAEAVDGLDASQLAVRLDADANPVSWLIWHLTRVQDDHVAAAFGSSAQVWSAGGWAGRLGLPPTSLEIGYGHTSAQVEAVSSAICGMPSPGKLLASYHEAVHAQTVRLVSSLTDADMERVVDTRWTPPVTLGVRLVSVISDDLEHVGQALYVRGILLRRAGG
ncbi:MAG: uncharacterized protein JWM19_5853 [Actinomycetia bacterium]|nr:uncharacterized protein [Actinomycetes bacterium]